MALTITAGEIVDWQDLASGGAEVGGSLDVSTHYSTTIIIQAFVDSETAHAGTEFIIQGRANTSTSVEDWYDIVRFVDLVDATPQETALGEAIDTNEPVWDLSEAYGDFNVGLVDGPAKWIGVEDADALAESELALQIDAVDAATDTITVLTDTQNAHDTDDKLYSVAISRGITIGIDHYYVRIVVNNNYDVNGSSINYRLRYVGVTGL